jgi:hypothetical protein
MKKITMIAILLSVPFQVSASMDIQEGVALKGSIFAVKTAKKYSSVEGCTSAANAKSRVKGFTLNTTSKKCTLYKSIRGERKNSSSVSGKKS